MVMRLIFFLFLLFLSGCAGLQKTANEPVHAEYGAGITIWKIPIIGFGSWGSSGEVPDVIIHKYDYQARPPALAPGTPPGTPIAPPVVDYSTIYSSAFDDPSLVIFKNDSYRKVRIEIDAQKPILLDPYGATANLHLGPGEHKVKIVIEKPTIAHGTWEVTRFFTIYISPERRSQIFHIYDY